MNVASGGSASLAAHMAAHAVSMNIAAPLACLAFDVRLPQRKFLSFATAMQIVLLFVWHASAHSPSLSMHVTLAATAVAFWGSVMAPDHGPLRPILALLITGKLVCFAGILLMFANRPIGHGGGALVDQQVAGLIMLATCSMSYMIAAVWLFWRWLSIDVVRNPNRALPSIGGV